MEAREEQQTKHVSRMTNCLNIVLHAICPKTCVLRKFIQNIKHKFNVPSGFIVCGSPDDMKL